MKQLENILNKTKVRRDKLSWELPNDFKYGIYSDGNYLASQELFKLNSVWWGLFEYYG